MSNKKNPTNQQTLVNKKIPIIVGVTGHRNIVDDDKPLIKQKVREALQEIKDLCAPTDKNGEATPLIMLNAFAQGADMLCAEVAFKMGIPVYALLPCAEEEYIKSFDNPTDRAKLHDNLQKTVRQIIAPDIEQAQNWMQIPADSYRYRQLGIYMAEHSHVLIALWDGKEPKCKQPELTEEERNKPENKFGCGTAEVVKFALEHDFLDKDRTFKPGAINDSAVVWIKCRRKGDGSAADVTKTWRASNLATRSAQGGALYEDSDTPPEFLKDIIQKTVEYNSKVVEVSSGKLELWKDGQESQLDDYRKDLDYHYAKANELACNHNQNYYFGFLLAIAILGTLVALTFLIYDDASIPYMIFPCTILLGIILVLWQVGKKKAFHQDYIKYRAFAEALRIQFYLSMCINQAEAVVNVTDLYSWTQKVDLIWIDKAIQALEVISPINKLNVPHDEIIDVWIGRNSTPEGQLSYHSRKRPVNAQKAKFYKKLSNAFRIVAVVIYFVIFAIEVTACVLKACNVTWFWESTIFWHLSWRNFAAIILGVFTAGSLLLSSYWGKLTYDRKADDNEKMMRFYASAYQRWQAVTNYPEEVEKFALEIAREEIVENGIWCSYVNENALDVNI